MRSSALGRRAAGLAALFIAGLPAPSALAQTLSPYFEPTGEGAYDLYNDAVWCGAVLEDAAGALPQGEDRERLEAASGDARAFALFMLDSGNVVDPGGAILNPDILPVDRRNARFDWEVVKLSLEDEGETPEAETTRCLGVYEAG